MKITTTILVIALACLGAGCASNPEKSAENLADTSPSSDSSAEDKKISSRNNVALDGDVDAKSTDVSASRTLSSASTFTQKLFDVQNNNADRLASMLGSESFMRLVAMLDNPETVSEVAPIVEKFLDVAGAAGSPPAINFNAPIESTQVSMGSGNQGADVRALSKDEAEAVKEIAKIIAASGGKEPKDEEDPTDPVDPAADPGPDEGE